MLAPIPPFPSCMLLASHLVHVPLPACMLLASHLSVYYGEVACIQSRHGGRRFDHLPRLSHATLRACLEFSPLGVLLELLELLEPFPLLRRIVTVLLQQHYARKGCLLFGWLSFIFILPCCSSRDSASPTAAARKG